MKKIATFYLLFISFFSQAQTHNYEQASLDFFFDNFQSFYFDRTPLSKKDTIVVITKCINSLDEDFFRDLSHATKHKMVEPNKYSNQNRAQNCVSTCTDLKIPKRDSGFFVAETGQHKTVQVYKRFYYDKFVYVQVVVISEDRIMSSVVLLKYDQDENLVDKLYYQYFN